MIGIFYGPELVPAEYTGRFVDMGDCRMYVYRGQAAPYQDAQIFSEQAPASIYVVPVHKINTFRDSGL